MRTVVRFLSVLLLAVALSLSGATPASAHEERESQFPAGDGTVPKTRSLKQAADVLVVCKADSRKRIRQLPGRKLRAFNMKLLKKCEYRDMQAAVDAVRTQRTNIYVLPGLYREKPSWDPPCAEGYDGGIVDYDLTVSCGEVVNLVTIAGDDPDDPDIKCDNQLCSLQMLGTGAKPSDVTLKGGFGKDGDWVKHNGIKADRADGFYLSNMRGMLFRENAFYIHETDGYVVEKWEGSHNQLYGILSFTSDHGRISDCNAHHNGDSGVYPGSAADVNSQSTSTGPLTRYAVEVTRCNIHHNALGFSGTAGNSVYVHKNRIHHNGMGFIVESILAGHRACPRTTGGSRTTRSTATSRTTTRSTSTVTTPRAWSGCPRRWATRTASSARPSVSRSAPAASSWATTTSCPPTRSGTTGARASCSSGSRLP
jgi:hypothetical protein